MVKKRLVYECAECAKVVECWGVRTPKRCPDCASERRRAAQSAKWNERREKAASFDRIVGVIEAGGDLGDVWAVVAEFQVGAEEGEG